ncbi:hypothetical protein [Luteitalea sp.]
MTDLPPSKPKFLYHGSHLRGLSELHPRRFHYRDALEKDAVFASPEAAMAACFIPRCLAAHGRFGSTFYFAAPRDEFLDVDRGGELYVVSSELFACEPEKGLGSLEWTCYERVQPVSRLIFESALEALISYSVQVFLLSETGLDQLRSAPDSGRQLLRGIASENAKRRSHVRDI